MTPSVAVGHPVTTELVAANLAHAHDRIGAAGRGAADVRIVAVTKGFGPDAVDAAKAVGLHDLGESFAEPLLARQPPTADAATAAPASAPDIVTCRWHFLGHVQRNKVARLAPVVSLWQAVDRVAAGEEIARRAPGARVLVQVNVSGEPQKHGATFDAAPALVSALCDLGLQVEGMMAVGPTGPPERARVGFRRLSELVGRLHLRECSMGMSDDFEVAVQEGSTMVRLGRALFGDRPSSGPVRR